MPKYIIRYNTGYGDMTTVEEFESLDEAERAAYETWREAAENNSDYEAILLTPESAEEWDHEDELGG